MNFNENLKCELENDKFSEVKIEPREWDEENINNFIKVEPNFEEWNSNDYDHGIYEPSITVENYDNSNFKVDPNDDFIDPLGIDFSTNIKLENKSNEVPNFVKHESDENVKESLHVIENSVDDSKKQCEGCFKYFQIKSFFKHVTNSQLCRNVYGDSWNEIVKDRRKQIQRNSYIKNRKFKKGTPDLQIKCKGCNHEYPLSSILKHIYNLSNKDCKIKYSDEELSSLKSQRQANRVSKIISKKNIENPDEGKFKGEKIYKCNFCEKIFQKRFLRRSHEKFHHEGIFDHVCLDCGQKFERQYYLKNHIKFVHQKIRGFKCENCDKEFKSSTERNAHNNIVHKGIKPYVCDICNDSFTTAYGLRYHKSR